MKILTSVLNDFKSFFSLKTKPGRLKSALVVLFFILIFVFVYSKDDEDIVTQTQDRAVFVSLVSLFSNETSVQLVGTVSATTRALIQSEAAGRVLNVPVKLGDTVSAGQVIVQLENASEYASVLQAEGSYEAALASAKAGDISVSEAQNNVVFAENTAQSAYESAYSVLGAVYYNDLDIIFADPTHVYRSSNVVLLATASIFNDLDDRFATYQNILATGFMVDGDANSSIERALDTTHSMLESVKIFRSLIITDEQNEVYSTTEASYLSTLSSVESKLNGVLASLRASQTSLKSAQSVLEKAELGGTSGDVSVANAQVKQALGSLKAAQASYNKTVLRSSIAGVVNSLSVQSGDFVSNSQKIAEIANNDALEVTTFVGQSDREFISVGQKVKIEGSVMGIVSAIAPAVNSSTGKIEVKIQSTSADLINGDTVIIAVQPHSETVTNDSIQVPLTAVKFTADAGSVFLVEDGKLASREVNIGSVRDIYIEIISGITGEEVIVVDVRGLSTGQKVTVIEN